MPTAWLMYSNELNIKIVFACYNQIKIWIFLLCIKEMDYDEKKCVGICVY